MATIYSHMEWGWVFLSNSWADSDFLTLHTDASGTLGYVGILGNKCFKGRGRLSSSELLLVLALHGKNYFLWSKQVAYGGKSLLIGVLFSIATKRLLLV